MVFNNSTTVFTTKFGLAYKLLLFMLVVFLVFLTIGMVTIYPTLSGMIKEINDMHLIKATLNYVQGILKGFDTDIEGESAPGYITFDELLVKFQNLRDTIFDYSTRVAVSFVLLAILIYLYCVMVSVMRYSTTSILNTFMSCNGKDGFLSNVLRNLRKSLTFGFACVSLSLLYYGVTIGLSIGIAVLVAKVNSVIGIMIAYLAIMISLSSKRALFAMWLPDMVVRDTSLGVALKNSTKNLPKTFASVFGAEFMIYLVFNIITAASLAVTVGIAIPIIFVIGLLFLQTYEMVYYYHHNNLRYYVDNQRVIDPTKEYKDAVLENAD
ncbi:MAG: hypothetical protein ACI4MI_04870 [Christensenellales bacterium]